MSLNSTHFFDVYLISPKSKRVAHPDSGILGETLWLDHGISLFLMKVPSLQTLNWFMPSFLFSHLKLLGFLCGVLMLPSLPLSFHISFFFLLIRFHAFVRKGHTFNIQLKWNEVCLSKYVNDDSLCTDTRSPMSVWSIFYLSISTHYSCEDS